MTEKTGLKRYRDEDGELAKSRSKAQKFIDKYKKEHTNVKLVPHPTQSHCWIEKDVNTKEVEK